jgi:hypothetical protein
LLINSIRQKKEEIKQKKKSFKMSLKKLDLFDKVDLLSFQQDSSLGSFEGEPVVSDESLPEIGLRAARADGAAASSRRSFQPRPVTASVDETLYENQVLATSAPRDQALRQSGRISYGPATLAKTPAQVWN